MRTTHTPPSATKHLNNSKRRSNHNPQPNGLLNSPLDSQGAVHGCSIAPFIEEITTNTTGNLEINFTYTVYEGIPSNDLGFRRRCYWVNDEDIYSFEGFQVPDWEVLKAYVNEASHGWWTINPPTNDKLHAYKRLNGPNTYRLLLKWDGRFQTKWQELIRVPFIPDGPSRLGRE